MGKKYLLGIDIGTSGCKIAIFDYCGKLRDSITERYSTYFSASGCAEQDANDWWSAVCRGIRNLISKEQINPSEIIGIGVDGQSWVCLPIDEEGKPLCKAMIWLDRRAEKEAKWLKEGIGEERLIQTSGNPVEPGYILPKMLWLKENKQDVYNNTCKFLQSNAYIVYKLTEKYSQDYSQAYGFHFFNISQGQWDENLAKELSINLDMMAPLVHCHDIVGTVTTQAAKETGLLPGIPVVAGGLDAACSALGAGVIGNGETQEQAGQAGGMSIVLGRALIHPKLILGYHVIPNKWLLQGGTVGGSGILRWYNQEFGFLEQQIAEESQRNVYEIFDEEVVEIAPGSDGLIFLPYMEGERSPVWDSHAKGVLLGLSYQKKRSQVIRSLMESVGFALFDNINTAEEKGIVIKNLVSVGGGANSKVWTQMKSDITNKTIYVPCANYATSLGAAILAGVGVGVYRDFNDAVRCCVKIQRTHNPDLEKHQLYQRYFKIYKKMYLQLKEIFKEMSDLGM